MKQLLFNLVRIGLLSIMFYLILNPFWYFGYNKIFSISLILGMFYECISYIKQTEL